MNSKCRGLFIERSQMGKQECLSEEYTDLTILLTISSYLYGDTDLLTRNREFGINHTCLDGNPMAYACDEPYRKGGHNYISDTG